MDRVCKTGLFLDLSNERIRALSLPRKPVYHLSLFLRPCLNRSSNAAMDKYRVAIDHQDSPKTIPRVGDGSVKVLSAFGRIDIVVSGAKAH